MDVTKCTFAFTEQKILCWIVIRQFYPKTQTRICLRWNREKTIKKMKKS